MSAGHWLALRERRRAASVVVAAATLACGLMPFAPGVAARADRDWKTWLAAVDAHVPGQRDTPLTAVSQWSRGDLEALLAPASADLWRVTPEEQRRRVERALLLHTDIAVLNRTANGYNLPATAGATALFRDGSAVGLMAATFHWEFARRVLQRLPQDDDRTHIPKLFFRSTSAVLELWGEYPELTTHLAAARKLLGDDPVMLMYEGTLHQAYAGARTQRFFFERRRARETARAGIRVINDDPTRLGSNFASAPLERGVDAALPTVKDEREQAERAFRRALAVDATLAEAGIRLAHVIGDAGRHAEALAELERVTTSSLTPMLGYYAALLMGRETRALARLDDARAHFERAAALAPNAAPPRYGLSEVAMARGDRAAARAEILRAAARPADINLLWGRIDRIHDPSATSLLADMRRSFSR